MKGVELWLPFANLCLLPLVSAQSTIDVVPLVPSVEENQAGVALFSGTYVLTQAGCDFTNILATSVDLWLQLDVGHEVQQRTVYFNVSLSTPVDYEKMTFFRVTVSIFKHCGSNQMNISRTVFVSVINLMDEKPVFTQSIYSASIPENQEVNTLILADIRAFDDDGSDVITHTIHFADQQNETFQVRPRADPDILDVYLMADVDFEQQNIHRFTITATDSVGLNDTCDVIIRVINIQDTPPIFTVLQYNGRINEDIAVRTPVLSVTAVDGDRVLTQQEWEGAAANEMHYSILGGDFGMFGINNMTGQIYTLIELDIDDNVNVTNGLVIMTVLAEELNTSLEPQYGPSNATALVLVQIVDVNDNRPQFNAQTFAGSIRAEAVPGEFVTIENGGFIAVWDMDQAPSNNRFTLHIEKDGMPWDVFRPNIEEQFAYASVMILLNRNNSLTHLSDTHLTFQIVAREWGSPAHRFEASKAEVNLWVKQQTMTPPPLEPVLNLPISASDIVVFLVGFMLLLNIALTIFICWSLSRASGLRMFFRNRQDKYYVSKRRSRADIHNSSEVNDATPHCKTKSDHVVTVGSDSRPQLDRSKSAATRNGKVHLNQLSIEQKDTLKLFGSDITKGYEPAADANNSHITTQGNLLKILNESESAPLENGTLTDTSFSQHVDRRVPVTHNGADVALTLNELQDSSRPSSADVSEVLVADVVPLITRSSHSKVDRQEANVLAQLNTNGTGEKDAGENVAKNQMIKKQRPAVPSLVISKIKTSASPKNPNKPAQKKKLPDFLSNKADQEPSHGSVPAAAGDNSDPLPVYQLTHTDLPAVALVLPVSKGALHLNKEPAGFINPVFDSTNESQHEPQVSQDTSPKKTSSAQTQGRSGTSGSSMNPEPTQSSDFSTVPGEEFPETAASGSLPQLGANFWFRPQTISDEKCDKMNVTESKPALTSQDYVAAAKHLLTTVQCSSTATEILPVDF